MPVYTFPITVKTPDHTYKLTVNVTDAEELFVRYEIPGEKDSLILEQEVYGDAWKVVQVPKSSKLTPRQREELIRLICEEINRWNDSHSQ
jgi:hypothetical protein